MQKVRAIVIHDHGAPEKVLRVEEQELRPLQPGEALVRILAAPINPADLNVIEGTYPVRPALPGVVGIEGCGVVEAIGSDVTEVRPGSFVLLPAGFGSWREAGIALACDLVTLPPGISLEQAAMLRINPPTAFRMLHDFVSLKPGDWFLQNASNSGVGRAAIQLAQALGFRSANLVRRPELVDELKAIGADAVLIDDDTLPEALATATGEAPIHLALNAVGGESASRLAKAVAPGATIVTYGAMSRKPIRVATGQLIFKDLRWRGFWISQWYRRASSEERSAMFDQLLPLAQNGKLHTPVERTFPIENALEALERAGEGQRAGKILFRFNPTLSP